MSFYGVVSSKNNVIYLKVSICEMCEAESKMIYIFFIKFYDAFKSDQMYGCLFRLYDSQKPITKYTPT